METERRQPLASMASAGLAGMAPLRLPIDSQDTLALSARTGVRSMNEVYPLDRVAEAFDRMLSGKSWFRVVPSIGK